MKEKKRRCLQRSIQERSGEESQSSKDLGPSRTRSVIVVTFKQVSIRTSNGGSFISFRISIAKANSDSFFVVVMIFFGQDSALMIMFFTLVVGAEMLIRRVAEHAGHRRASKAKTHGITEFAASHRGVTAAVSKSLGLTSRELIGHEANLFAVSLRAGSRRFSGRFTVALPPCEVIDMHVFKVTMLGRVDPLRSHIRAAPSFAGSCIAHGVLGTVFHFMFVIMIILSDCGCSQAGRH
mmetsp:Transcript_101470/g.293542  ORF Transcript_101470/g.293542 Transcript_101470/m.293542 type:complete len:237 (-) Transcript_101470:129-839(-)